MAISTLILTIATCLSASQNAVAAQDIERLYASSEELIAKSAESFDYSSYDLDYDGGMSLTKQELYSYYEDSLSALERTTIKKSITESDDYKYFSDVAGMYLKIDCIASFKDVVSNFDALQKDTIKINSQLSVTTPLSSSGSSNQNVSTCKIDNTFHLYEGGGSGGCSSEETINFPIHPYNESNIKFVTKCTLDGTAFIGLYFSPDACTAFYSKVSTWMNDHAVYAASQMKSPVSLIYSGIKKVIAAAALSIELVRTVVATITAAFAKIYSYIAAFIASIPGVIKTIIAAIIGMAITACIVVMANIFVYGSKMKGYALGFKKKTASIFWEPYAGEALQNE